MSVRSQVLSVVIAIALAIAAGCGGSSSSGSSTTGSSSPSTSTGGSSSSGGGGGFCGQGKADISGVQAKLAAIAASLTSQPSKIKQQLQALSDAYKQAQSQAPAEIQGDIGTISSFITKLQQLYAQHNYDPMATAQAAQGLFSGAQAQKLQSAADHLGAWAKANCGA